ncbi:FAD-dependent monooxygenase [Rugosimonospora acidiphila]|uniref:FAD-dependent monooxygenase n=1 Tax=Rugosimonospora acidiphila TaxID=556531 RepID=A0ABP9SJ09_9ACTN
MSGNTRALISGAGIAGPSLAYWLRRAGYAVTVVEQADGPREGGSAVDFRGAQVRVLERMGILADVRARQTGMGGQTVVDADGRPIVTLPAHVFSGEIEIARGELTRLLHDRTRDDVEYVFGDSIASLTETDAGVDVAFRRGAPRTFDLVVGADGSHSVVRRLVFGDERRFREDTGLCVAGCLVPNILGLESGGVLYNEPGLGVLVGSRDHTTLDLQFVWTSPPLTYDYRDVARQKQIVSGAFSAARWRTPELLELMRDADDLFFDSISQIALDRYSRGRVVLLGDAAWSAGPGGGGTGLAMGGAYTLAGELATARGDHRVAFARYEQHLRAGVAAGHKQAKGAAPFLAPLTDKKIAQRNRGYKWLSKRPLASLFARMTEKAANAMTLKDYPVEAYS